MIRKAKKLRLMFSTFFDTLPQLANIGALLTLVLFLYSVLGMNLFCYLKINDNGGGITSNVNF